MRAAIFLVALLPAWASLGWAIDVESLKQEPNLERRSERAMENAQSAFERARDAFQAAKGAEAKAAVEEVIASVDVANESLDQSGKEARRSPKYFKKAEMAARQLLRRIEALKTSVDFDDQPLVERLREHVSAFHDELIGHIMGKKK